MGRMTIDEIKKEMGEELYQRFVEYAEVVISQYQNLCLEDFVLGFVRENAGLYPDETFDYIEKNAVNILKTVLRSSTKRKDSPVNGWKVVIEKMNRDGCSYFIRGFKKNKT